MQKMTPKMKKRKTEAQDFAADTEVSDKSDDDIPRRHQKKSKIAMSKKKEEPSRERLEKNLEAMLKKLEENDNKKKEDSLKIKKARNRISQITP